MKNIANCELQIANWRAVNPQSAIRTPQSEVGLTLVEVMIVAAVLMIVMTGLVGSFVALGSLRESAKNLTLAVNDAAKVMEQIRTTNFQTQRSATYCSDLETTVNASTNNTYWSITRGESIDIVCYKTGTTSPPDADTDLIDVYVTVSWREGRGAGRVIGEDQNLDGDCADAGEDGSYPAGSATNGRCDSPAQLVSKVTDRGN